MGHRKRVPGSSADPEVAAQIAARSQASAQRRQDVFALPRSSWEDYDPALISVGGGVYGPISQVGPYHAAGPPSRSFSRYLTHHFEQLVCVTSPLVGATPSM